MCFQVHYELAEYTLFIFDGDSIGDDDTTLAEFTGNSEEAVYVSTTGSEAFVYMYGKEVETDAGFFLTYQTGRHYFQVNSYTQTHTYIIIYIYIYIYI